MRRLLLPTWDSSGRRLRRRKIHAALRELGFSKVYEVALGADIGAVTEAHDYVIPCKNRKDPVSSDFCCPSWAMLAKKQFPEIIDSVSKELTPMVATARSIKKEHPNARVVFIGPCAAKKLEAMRRTVRSDVDFVITFEELDAMFTARGIDPARIDHGKYLHDATAAGRGYGVAGGVADAIVKCINEYYPAQRFLWNMRRGWRDCRKVLMQAKAGRKNGYLIEGMGCPGGCVAGAGTLLPVANAKKEVQKIVRDSTKKLPPKELRKIELN